MMLFFRQFSFFYPLVALFAALVFSGPVAAAAVNKKTVLVSVAPLALLVNDLVAKAQLTDKIEVQVLLPAGASPHHLSLKLSDIQRIQKADLLVWVGPSLENFLPSAIAAQRKGKANLKLLDLAGLHKIETQHGHDHHHVEGGDPHIWLDPNNAAVITTGVSAYLAELMPAHADALAHALQQTEASLAALRAAQQARLLQLNIDDMKVAVYHDSLGHYMNPFGIQLQAVLTEVPEEQIGLKSMLAHAKENSPACLLADRGEIRQATAVANKLAWPVVEYDLLAQGESLQTYSAYLTKITDAFEACFRKKE